MNEPWPSTKLHRTVFSRHTPIKPNLLHALQVPFRQLREESQSPESKAILAKEDIFDFVPHLVACRCEGEEIADDLSRRGVVVEMEHATAKLDVVDLNYQVFVYFESDFCWNGEKSSRRHDARMLF